ncbi:hypothetical protein DPSP01_009970 [Paraphaeosphaeria sporulosa]|uniref:Uncharacterized protein n=1 Tax=Paraphaeosphaeria sporulosa TaxID=1460663 RepID=A0A177CG74_9PLEO|nr:uncharacterized protein CC84DRAFT_1145702 [Paraphaeosphaeria sporulosa]OAG05952.1 hypothetical protein CC84DRAFT_1145702 [Paraphaeosphaeria sporulosa]
MGMRVLVFAWLCLLMLGNVRGLQQIHSRELGIADIPPCGLTCLLPSIADSGCGITDYQCQCGNTILAKRVSACMLANCTMEDALGFSQVQDDVCDLSEDSKSNTVLICTCVCYPLAIFFVTLRLVGKVMSKRVRLEDWIIVSSLILAAMPIACVVKMTTIGFGEHLWNLKPGQLLHSLRYFYIAWSTYVIVLAMMKASLIMFYLEIFPLKRVRIIAYIILGWIVINSLILFFLTIFNCRPVNAFWDRDIKGQCMNINALAFANSGTAIAQDIVLLIFPLVCIRQLKMQRARKFAVGLMFSIGTFGCIASIIRLQSLFTFEATLDPTWDYVPVTIWTEIELACGYVCVSLPAIRVLIGRVFHTSIFSSMARSRNTNDMATPQNSVPKQMPKAIPTQVKKKRQTVWMRLSAAAYKDSPGSPAAVAWPAGWSPRPWSGPQRTPTKSHQRLGSDHGSVCNFSHVRTCTPPVPDQTSRSGHDVELGIVPQPPSKAAACLSCGTDNGYLTALPTLGCLPDRNFSNTDLRRPVTSNSRWHKCSVWNRTAGQG